MIPTFIFYAVNFSYVILFAPNTTHDELYFYLVIPNAPVLFLKVFIFYIYILFFPFKIESSKLCDALKLEQ